MVYFGVKVIHAKEGKIVAGYPSLVNLL